jgi:hypothetical protein
MERMGVVCGRGMDGWSEGVCAVLRGWGSPLPPPHTPPLCAHVHGAAVPPLSVVESVAETKRD